MKPRTSDKPSLLNAVLCDASVRFMIWKSKAVVLTSTSILINPRWSFRAKKSRALCAFYERKFMPNAWSHLLYILVGSDVKVADA